LIDPEQLIEQRRDGVAAAPAPAQAAYEPRRWLAWHRGDQMPFNLIAALVGRPEAVVEAAVRSVLEADAAADARSRSCRSRPMSQPTSSCPAELPWPGTPRSDRAPGVFPS
jgi:hypothetical protein